MLFQREMIPLMGKIFLYIIEEIEGVLEEKESFKINNSLIYER
jgi:hypothetical protein